MEISEQNSQQGRIYHLKGRFDAHQVPQFKSRLESGQGNLTLDFSQVNFIDSTGLATLVSLYKKTKHIGQQFKIVNLQDQVRVIFEITQLHTVLPIDIS
jgi:anti-sigma B factor antagonist